MASWFQRRTPPVTGAAVSAFRYGGPTSDASSGSTSITAAASRVTSKKVKRGREVSDSWQHEAWAMYDAVGELRYVANAIAGRCGQAGVFVEKGGERQDKPENDPILALITPQMVERLALNIFVAGGGYLAGLPKEESEPDPSPDHLAPEGGTESAAAEWLILSAVEVTKSRNGKKVSIRGREYVLDDIYLEKIWDPHPAHWEEADSPVRSALPVLRELVGLTQHVSAQIDSRLAGAGVYWIPNTILQSAKVPDQGEGQTTFSDNAVLNAIMNAMLVPLEDRSNAAAVVPALFGAPDDAISKIRFDTFATPFDENTKDLREEAIRRLGLALDAPPELLQGMGDANHWGMWLVRDEVVQAHVKPRLELIWDALTTAFYRPILRQLQGKAVPGTPEGDPDTFTLKPDVGELVQRPNRLADASQLHAVQAVGDKALRTAGGFEESDAPSSKERAIAVALQVATQNPQLLDNMTEIVSTVMALLDGTPETGPGDLSSARRPGTLDPLEPENRGQAPSPRLAPNGTPTPGGAAPAPITDTEGVPASGNPVA